MRRGFLPPLSTRRSKPKGTSVEARAHQETNLVSIFDLIQSLATEGFEREVLVIISRRLLLINEVSFQSTNLHVLSDSAGTFGLCIWVFLAELKTSRQRKHFGEIKTGNYINAFLTKCFLFQLQSVSESHHFHD